MRFVVRRPIFNYQEGVDGYELNLEQPATGEPDPAETVATVAIALQRIPPQTRVTVGCGHSLLNSSALRQLPPARVVLAIDPHDEDPEERLRAARTLRESGYSLTLLDFAPELGIEKYLGLVDAVGVKTDRDLAVVSAYLQRIRGRTLRMIAREVATRADWAVAEKAGFRYFHGAYFLQPAQE